MPSLPFVPDRLRASLGRRGMALLLALVFEALLLLLFLFLTPALQRKKPVSAIFGFNVESGEEAADASKAKQSDAKAKGREEKRAPTPPTPPAPTDMPQPQQDVPWPPGFIHMSRAEFRATDVAALKSSGGPPTEGDGAAASGAGDSAQVGGKGPNGEPLYAAEWYVEPTHAQLGPYISARARQSGYGLIACRTVPNYRVEDCQELSESPVGSGLSGAARQAAWQFRVRPPRVGGRAMVGAWVRIRIDYTIGPAG